MACAIEVRYEGSTAEAEQATAVAARLGLEVAVAPGLPRESSSGHATPPFLLRTEGAWSIVVAGLGPKGAPLRFSLDLAGEGLSARQRRRLAEPPSAHSLFAALGRPEPGSQVVDATGGFGSDALLMAVSFGLAVTVVERHPLAFFLLEDAARRAAVGSGAPLFDGPVVHARAEEVLPQLSADIVFLDPMFPRDRPRKSKPDLSMQVLGALCGTPRVGWPAPLEADTRAEAQLLEAARRCARRRVVVKRARKSGPFAGARPVGSHVGRTNRFDIYRPLGSD